MVSKAEMQKCTIWGYDLTGFKNQADWKKFRDKYGCRLSLAVDLYGENYAMKAYGHENTHFIWKCNGVEITTSHPGSSNERRPDFDGYLGYMAVEFNDKSRPKWNKMRADFKKMADIKEETPCESGFTSTPSDVRARLAEKK